MLVWPKSGKYLGHVISGTDPDKISMIKSQPKSTIMKAMRRFFSLTSYYRKIAVPLTRCCRQTSQRDLSLNMMQFGPL